MWTTPEGVATSSELPVKDWTFPRTPESGGAAFTSAPNAFGVAIGAVASKHMDTRFSSFMQVLLYKTVGRAVAISPMRRPSATRGRYRPGKLTILRLLPPRA